jgi:hypothetical protein
MVPKLALKDFRFFNSLRVFFVFQTNLKLRCAPSVKGNVDTVEEAVVSLTPVRVRWQGVHVVDVVVCTLSVRVDFILLPPLPDQPFRSDDAWTLPD